MNSPVPCVVLAGGKTDERLRAATGAVNRSMVPVNGKTLLQHVTDALAAAPEVGDVIIVGDVPPQGDLRILPEADSFLENLIRGVTALSEEPMVLVATSDLPFITGEAISEFVTKAAVAFAEGARYVYPIVPVAACYARFPGVKRTCLRLREGEFTGGNLMLVQPQALIAGQDRILAAYKARKSPPQLAVLIGSGALVRLLLSQLISPKLLTLPYLERAVGRMFGADARAVICDHPEIATDLDRPSDFEAVGIALPEPPA